MPDTKNPQDLFPLTAAPGVKRDGTDFDSPTWVDAQWVRFQRGRPRKIGGYRAVSNVLRGPVRQLYVDARATYNTAHAFSQWGVEQLQFDNSGALGGVANRTPSSGFDVNANYTWTAGSMFQSGGGGTSLLVAAATPDLESIASDNTGYLYQGAITSTTPLTRVEDGSGPIEFSGGCCVLQPFVFVYGSDGLIRNSNPNDISTASGWTTGGSNYASEANVAGTKIVKGLAVRGGGQSPSGLFWSLDSLVRVSFLGGSTIWRYDTLSDDISVLSKSSILEYDNMYFWIGVDRFYMFNGVVQEIPNDMNLNWFFDNLNFSQRQKVFALKVPRYGEIWWFFPSGTSTECDKAIIFNVREKTWYDTSLARTAAFPARVFPYPLMTGEPRVTTLLDYTVTAGVFAPGMEVRGVTSGATGIVVVATTNQLNLRDTTGTFLTGETVTDTTFGGANTGTIGGTPSEQELTTLWTHEQGSDRVEGQAQLAIPAWVQSNTMQWTTGGPGANGAGADFGMRITSLEPDFIMSGEMQLQVVGHSYPQAPEQIGVIHTFNADTKFVDLREQRRMLGLKFTSNVVGGDFQMGRCLVKLEPGDERG